MKARFLVDESLGKRFSHILKRAGYDAVFVGDVLPEVEDEIVLILAEKENRILITADKDFGELIFSLGKASKGVILLRTLTRDPDKRFNILSDMLKNTNPEGKFIVVSESRTRVRGL